ncbi:group 1 truncated hemoglobin [Elioraea sp.]|uniref:group I truncated hemoglobin n=1 Tax=Elioraea sp. TaxID=2185103 RepID=UPI0021DC9B40|nr:group 1 truncated hemoglobin [Elioraea sp.]GIX10245.1 MAG: cyanoglobin [Elioraea sp.]
MHRIAALALALLCSAAPPAHAATLFERLGGMAGITRIVDRMVELGLADPRIAEAFDNTNIDRLKGLIARQFCTLTGGPCAPRRRSMYAAHAHLGLTTFHFNALVEDLQQAMDEEGIPFHTQNRLLAILAPMHREIVTR